ncbi:MAG: type II secretion system protein GspL [Rhodoferax sp.]
MTVLLTPVRTDTETVAMVPGHLLSWHRVTLPRGVLGRGGARRGSRLRGVLEGLLEEQLLDEPAALHFALPPQAREGEPLWVAVAQTEALAQGVQTLRAQGHVVQRLVPEWVPTAGDAPAPVLWACGSADMPMLAWNDAHGVHRWPLPPQRQGEALPAPVQQALQQGAVLRAEPAVASWAQEWLGPEVAVHTAQERLLDAARSSWDLAQGDLPLHTAWPQRVQQGLALAWQSAAWAPARAALALALLVQLVGVNALAWKARQHEQALQSAITRTLTDTFPQTTVVVDAPTQMARALATLRQDSGAATASDIDTMLQNAQQNWPPALENKGFDAIEFEAGELRLKGAPLESAALGNWQQALAAQGLALGGQGAQWQLRAAGERP